ncbi:phenylalanine--tRNA ligase subunit beta [Desulfobulbus elongatus]|uniref:phenylalanine--tRNA ligase subunit beta n=1 Tax=Desulfobulbus elongatus TaxID=53332 RepID=UPI000480B52D|nr:phenylalanine--tRNA ligase subunit beta [Desulfobulbus elongatus]
MKFTLSWLNQFIATEGLTAARIADNLTMLGLEVDSVTPLFAELEPIMTARVAAVDKHPDADKLTVCAVDTGTEVIQVVCGAPNVRPGMVTAIALPGVKLPDGTKIKKSKVRGVVSAGMLCSARELGLSNDHQGLIELDGQLAAGLPLVDALGLRDTVIEVDLTPNRPDCASVRGIAREVGSFVTGTLKPLVAAVTPLTGRNIGYEVIIEEPDLCPRYTARKLTNVTIGPSPLWMQQRLTAVGMRPINNIVDITNYVMLECGQPMHAFDFTTLRGQKIVVRQPRTGETSLTTLDGSPRQLDPEMLLICDAERPVAVAGVMGGLETEITGATTTILLESACFNPVSIRRTARKLGIPSESSYRFERGVDPNLADSALERAVALVVELAGAQADPDGIDVYPGNKPPLCLRLRVERVCSLLGTELSRDQIARYLKSIEFQITSLDETTLEVEVPSFRVDIEREIDLVEEVARLVGYNAIPTSQPSIRMDSPGRDPLRSLRQQVARIMTAQGFFEAINYSFVAETHLAHCRLTQDDHRRQVTRLLNPLSEEQGIMRSLLLPGLLENVRRNINFQRPDIRLFEMGKIFLQKQEGMLPEERMHLCAVISGHRHPEAEPLYFAAQEADFFDIKGLVTNLLLALRITGSGGATLFGFESRQVQPYCDPDCAAVICDDEKVIGSLGAVHPETLKGFGIKQPVYFFELDLKALLAMERTPPRFAALPKYPSVKRDISLVVPDTVPAGDLLRAIQSQQQKYLESVEIFDVYRGKPIQVGHKSVALSVTYRSATATLDDQSVDKIHDKIVNTLMTEFKARYREGSEA